METEVQTKDVGYTTRKSCRVCGHKKLIPLFNLGDQYVSDFVNAGATPHRCPIEIEMCQNCSLVQSRHTAPQDFLYTRHYWYRSGVTDTMREALANVVMEACKKVVLEPDDVVLDIGSNDGTLLRFYPNNLIRIGVEPATNLATFDNYKDLILINDFWSVDAYNKFVDAKVNHRPKIITACGMFYDLEDPNQFIGDIAKVLHPDGVFVAQLMCLKQTLESRDIGNFAHEHLEFYTIDSLDVLLISHGLKIVDIHENQVNGGSYRLFIKHVEQPHDLKDGGFTRVCHYAKVEDEMGLRKVQTYRDFIKELEENRQLCIEFITRESLSGKKIWVYGASTKGNVILQYYGLDYRIIEAAADRSPEKVGKFTVGSGIPIKSEDDFRESNPDYALVLPYAFINEFTFREMEWLRNGGKFIVPLPRARIIEGNGHYVKSTLLK